MIADTSFLVALLVQDDSQHKKAESDIKNLKSRILIPDRVAEELFTVLSYKKGVIYASESISRLKRNKKFSIIPCDSSIFDDSISLAQKIKKKMSFVDYSLLFLSKKRNDSILTYDKQLKNSAN